MAYQTVYCRSEILEEIVLYKDEIKSYDLIYSIMDKHSDVIVDLSKEEFEKQINENIIYKQFVKKAVGQFDHHKPFFDKISDEDFGQFPTEIFILNDNELDAKNVREVSGCFVISYSEINLLDSLNMPLGYSFSKKLSAKNNFQSWTDILQAKSMAPCNSAVLIDNFLYDKPGKYDSFKIENIFKIICAIIPKSLETTFHLTLVIDNREFVFKKENATFLITELKSEVKTKIGVDIEIGVITHSLNDEIHQRAIITNHHYLWSDKGFSVFLLNSNKIETKLNTHGEINWLYRSVNSYIGELPKDDQIRYLLACKSQMIKNKTSVDSAKFNEGFVDNRLFSLIE